MHCYCVAMCGWFLRQVAKSTKDEGGDYDCEVLSDGCKWIKRI